MRQVMMQIKKINIAKQLVLVGFRCIQDTQIYVMVELGLIQEAKRQL